MFAASKWLYPKAETPIFTNLTARSLLLSGDFNTTLKIWNMDMKYPAAADTGSQKTLGHSSGKQLELCHTALARMQ